jgi:hypothetical protein
MDAPLPPPELPPPEPPLSAPELPSLPEFPGFFAVPEKPMQPAAQQSMMTVIVTSTTVPNPGGVRHIPEFPTITISSYPEGYCSTVIKEEHLSSGTPGG